MLWNVEHWFACCYYKGDSGGQYLVNLLKFKMVDSDDVSFFSHKIDFLVKLHW